MANLTPDEWASVQPAADTEPMYDPSAGTRAIDLGDLAARVRDAEAVVIEAKNALGAADVRCAARIAPSITFAPNDVAFRAMLAGAIRVDPDYRAALARCDVAIAAYNAAARAYEQHRDHLHERSVIATEQQARAIATQEARAARYDQIESGRKYQHVAKVAELTRGTADAAGRFARQTAALTETPDQTSTTEEQ